MGGDGNTARYSSQEPLARSVMISGAPAAILLADNIHKSIIFILQNHRKSKLAQRIIRAHDLRLFKIEDDDKVERCCPVSSLKQLQGSQTRPQAIHTADGQSGSVMDRDLRIVRLCL